MLCSEKLNYANDVEKCIAGKYCSVTYKVHSVYYLELLFYSDKTALSFEAK